MIQPPVSSTRSRTPGTKKRSRPWGRERALPRYHPAWLPMEPSRSADGVGVRSDQSPRTRSAAPLTLGLRSPLLGAIATWGHRPFKSRLRSELQRVSPEQGSQSMTLPSWRSLPAYSSPSQPLQTLNCILHYAARVPFCQATFRLKGSAVDLGCSAPLSLFFAARPRTGAPLSPPPRSAIRCLEP